ncbi:MAG TPA: putative metal-binding motif-containing protein [Polyangia bacterium]|nr:putative metal-binding motif-containing protein [Polyangia bacterium]
MSGAVLLALGAPAAAWAHASGIAATGCEGCHSGGQTPTVTVTASPVNPGVGQQVTVTVTVSQTNGPVAGFYLTADAPAGALKAIQAGTALSEGGVMHTMPHAGANGSTVFQAAWTATQATGVTFTAYALSANGDGSSRGDGGGEGTLSMTAGCPGTDYYIDQDADGYGTNDPAYPVSRDCALPAGYALVAGDCDDFEASIHPGAKEVCNGKDDDCNGQVDEGLPRQFYCRDRDGDGHGVPAAGEQATCRAMPGYGDCGGDCDDADPTRYVQFTCGTGWCRRTASGCSTVCTPGEPTAEVCNAFDDDCDGVADNGTDLQLCGAGGLKCVAGVCVAAGSTGGSGQPDAASGTGGEAGAGDTGRSEAGGCALAPRSESPNGGVAAAVSLVLGALARRERRAGARRNRRCA